MFNSDSIFGDTAIAPFPNRVRYIIVHCTATPQGRDVTVADIDACHRARGFDGIGYHYVVRTDGTVEAGRPESKVGAHCVGLNNCSIGVCYVGGVLADGHTPADTRTAAQKESLVALLGWLKERYPSAEIRGHRDFAAKACPSFDAAEYRGIGATVGAVVATVTLDSCNTHKKESVSTDVVEVRGHDSRLSGTFLDWSVDSMELVVDNPELTVSCPDSLAVMLRGSRAVWQRHSERAGRAEMSAQIADSAAVGVSNRVVSQSDSDVSLWSPWGWIAVAFAAAVVLWLNRR